MSKLAEVKKPIKLTEYLATKKGWKLNLGYNQCPICYKKKLKVFDDNIHLTCYNPSCQLHGTNLNKRFLDIYDILIVTKEATNISEAYRIVINSPLNTYQSITEVKSTQINYNKIFEVYKKEAKNNKRVWEYLDKRGLKCQELEYLIGYAQGDILRTYFKEEYLEERNLLSKTGEFFKDRIIFPIRDIHGNIVHLQGRALDSLDELRWLSTKTNTNGNINNHIFNKDKIKDNHSIFLCEGISDTLSLLSLGLPAAGVLGNQIDLNTFKDLKHLKEVFVLFDSDKFPLGGKYEGEYKSWARAYPVLTELMLRQKISIWAALLPNQVGIKDCNDWIASGISRKEVVEYWNKYNCSLGRFGLKYLNQSKFPEVHRSILRLINTTEELEEYKKLLNNNGTNLLSIIQLCLETPPLKFTWM